MCVSQYWNHFLTSGELYSPAEKPHEMAAAVRAGRPPPPPWARLYMTPPSAPVDSLRYLTAFLIASGGTLMPELRADRSAWTWVMVTEPSSKPPPSRAET